MPLTFSTYTPPPTGMPAPFVQCAYDDNALGPMLNSNLKTAVSAVWPVASIAMFVPYVITEPHTYQGMWWMNGAAVSGAVNAALYSADGITSYGVVGSIAQAGTTVYQNKAFAAPVTIGPGQYFMALSQTDGIGTIVRASVSLEVIRGAGGRSLVSFFNLATSAAAWIGTTQGNVPCFGLYEGTWR